MRPVAAVNEPRFQTAKPKPSSRFRANVSAAGVGVHRGGGLGGEDRRADDREGQDAEHREQGAGAERGVEGGQRVLAKGPLPGRLAVRRLDDAHAEHAFLYPRREATVGLPGVTERRSAGA